MTNPVSDKICKTFFAQAEKEGFLFGGMKPTTKHPSDLIAVLSDKTLCYVNFIGRIAAGSDAENLLKTDVLFYVWDCVIIESLLFADNSCDDPSAVAAGVVFGDCTHDRRAAAGAAIFDNLFCKGDPQHAAVLFGRATAQITLFDRFYDFFINPFGSNTA